MNGGIVRLNEIIAYGDRFLAEWLRIVVGPECARTRTVPSRADFDRELDDYALSECPHFTGTEMTTLHNYAEAAAGLHPTPPSNEREAWWNR